MFKIIKFVKKFTIVTATITLMMFFVGLPGVRAVSPEAPVITKASIVVDGSEKILFVEGTAPKETEILVYINNNYFGTTVVQSGKFIFSQLYFDFHGRINIISVARNSATQEISSLSNSIVPIEILKKDPVKTNPPIQKHTVAKIKPIEKEEIKEKKIVEELKEGEISEEAVKEEQELPPIVAGYEDEYPETSIDSETLENQSESLKSLEDILSSEKSEELPASTGIINETQEKLGKIKLNVFLFLIFLVAVITWIIWVNRELIKEKQEENRKD